MRMWYDEWSRQVRVYKEDYCPEYPNGKVTHKNFIIRLNGEIMSMVLHADTDRGTVTFHDKIGCDVKTKTGNVTIHEMGATGVGQYSHMGPPITVVST